jgi:hypothetical protein
MAFRSPLLRPFLVSVWPALPPRVAANSKLPEVHGSPATAGLFALCVRGEGPG